MYRLPVWCVRCTVPSSVPSPALHKTGAAWGVPALAPAPGRWDRRSQPSGLQKETPFYYLVNLEPVWARNSQKTISKATEVHSSHLLFWKLFRLRCACLEQVRTPSSTSHWMSTERTCGTWCSTWRLRASPRSESSSSPRPRCTKQPGRRNAS